MSIISSDAKWAVLQRAVSLSPEEILKWHRSKAATPEYTAKLLGVPLDEVLYIIAHPETPAPHKDDFTPEFIEPLI